MPGFEIIEGITSADLAFRVEGSSIEELFLRGGQALMSLMVENWQDIASTEERTIELNDDHADMLYYRFLDELLFFRDAETLLLVPHTVSILLESNTYRLQCQARGERIDTRRHRFNTGIKAVTMHHLKVGESPSGWHAQVVLDL